jgi:hypothetical protein
MNGWTGNDDVKQEEGDDTKKPYDLLGKKMFIYSICIVTELQIN